MTEEGIEPHGFTYRAWSVFVDAIALTVASIDDRTLRTPLASPDCHSLTTEAWLDEVQAHVWELIDQPGPERKRLDQFLGGLRTLIKQKSGIDDDGFEFRP